MTPTRLALVTTLSVLALGLSSGPGSTAGLKVAVFAGGCFWSMEKALEHLPGVTDAVVGYSGGRSRNPTYENHEGHLESVRVTYDPSKISYAKLVDAYFHNIDPTDPAGQFCDYGPSYRTAVFTADPTEKAAAEQVMAQVAKTLKRPVATRILPATTFWIGEDYHQDFAVKNPGRYAAYRIGCGRDAKLKAVWAGR